VVTLDHVLVHRVGHRGDEPLDDRKFAVAELVEDGVGAIAERPEERQAGRPALVGIAQVNDLLSAG
jgi:hypothetical protein